MFTSFSTLLYRNRPEDVSERIGSSSSGERQTSSVRWGSIWWRTPSVRRPSITRLPSFLGRGRDGEGGSESDGNGAKPVGAPLIGSLGVYPGTGFDPRQEGAFTFS